MSEMVESPDAELVSRMLETCLRAQWNDVAREGGTIVLRGLGPSHRVNRNDRAVFAVKIAEDGRTAIEADVTYQASALVGTGAPQNELVRRKLDSVLELVRMDLDLAQRRAAQGGESDLKPRLVNKSAAMGMVTEMPEMGGAGIQESGIQVSGIESGGTSQIEGTKDAESTAESVAAKDEIAMPPKVEQGATSEFGRVAARLAAAGAGAGAARSAMVSHTRVASEGNGVAPRIATEQRLVHRGEELWRDDDEDVEEAKERSVGQVFGILVVVFVLIGLAQAGWQYRVPLGRRAMSWRTAWSGTQPAAAVTDSSGTGAPPAVAGQAGGPAATGQADPVAAEKAGEAAKLAESDPKKWLANWADALRGQDAAAQAAYYADPVDKYFLRRDVSRADVMADKAAAIAKRTGVWTLTLDDMVVAQQTDETARILMVKHIVIDDGAAGKREQRLPTQIRLKQIDGQWRIVSEQTLA